jgi:hypothetical protein
MIKFSFKQLRKIIFKQPFQWSIRLPLKQTVYCMSLCLLLSSCVQTPVFKSKNHAHIKSNYPIVEINGAKIEDSYQLDLVAGENSLVIVYNTYQYDYFCTFQWTAVAETAYEVTDQENKYPLTLYRWRRRNDTWAIWLDPANPIECIEKSSLDD